MTQFRQIALATAMAAASIAATAANAQTTVITREPVQTETVVTRPVQPLALTPVQRQTVYRTIVRERVAPAQPTVTYRVGMRVPQTAQVYEVPREVVTEVPAMQPYRYMVVNNHVLLVDPATSEVVDELTD